MKYLVMNMTCEWQVCHPGVFKLENGYTLAWAAENDTLWCKHEDELAVIQLNEDPGCVVAYSEIIESMRKLGEAQAQNIDLKMAIEKNRDQTDQLARDLASCREEKIKIYDGVTVRNELINSMRGAIGNLLDLLEQTNGHGIRSHVSFQNANALVTRAPLADPQGYPVTTQPKG